MLSLMHLFGYGEYRILIVFLVLVVMQAGCTDATEPDELTPMVEELVLLAGSDQTASVAMTLPVSPEIEARDATGNPVPHTRINFEVIEGDGWIVAEQIETNSQGRVSNPWYMGPLPGDQRLSISSGNADLFLTAEAEPLVIGDTLWGFRNWVEFIPGELPVVMTAPHGGTERPFDIPDRTYGATIRDYATDELAHFMAQELEKEVGTLPHLVVLHLHRIKLDANRDIDEAAQGNKLAERAWREFHGFTEAAKAWVEQQYGEGFYIDIHGHGHQIQRLELGYLLTSADLERSDAELNQSWAVSKSSFRTLVQRSGRTHSDLIRGPSSLGTLYEEEGYPSVPSTDQYHPGGNPFFTGGYNTRRHSCRDGGSICGFQLEANRLGVRDTQGQRRAFAVANARVLNRFFEENYGYSLETFGLTAAHK